MSDWIAQIKTRKLHHIVTLLLDVLEPVSPLSAQVLWIIQPAGSMLGWRKAIGEIAEALEEPGGVERIRRALEMNDETGMGL